MYTKKSNVQYSKTANSIKNYISQINGFKHNYQMYIIIIIVIFVKFLFKKPFLSAGIQFSRINWLLGKNNTIITWVTRIL
jgi:hypothetical protein